MSQVMPKTMAAHAEDSAEMQSEVLVVLSVH